MFSRGNEILLDTSDDSHPEDLHARSSSSWRTTSASASFPGRTSSAPSTAPSPSGEARRWSSSSGTSSSFPTGFARSIPARYNQALYLESIERNEIVFGVGPAGTGKTYLAVAQALKQVLGQSRRKLIITRPVVEAGESLGYLPGDLTQKIHPYLRPLYDAIESLIPMEIFRRLEENGVIEIAPLAYMRGRTLSDAFIILDEAQNTTREQMKMFLTRIGENSRTVVTGDITQIDLPRKSDSGPPLRHPDPHADPGDPLHLLRGAGRGAQPPGAQDRPRLRNSP